MKTKLSMFLIPYIFLVWIVDIATLIHPQKYLQNNSAKGIEMLSYYRVKIALFLGADPNIKYLDGSTPFYMSYLFDRKNILKLLLPIADCENLKKVVDYKVKKTNYKIVSLEYNLRCKSIKQK